MPPVHEFTGRHLWKLAWKTSSAADHVAFGTCGTRKGLAAIVALLLEHPARPKSDSDGEADRHYDGSRDGRAAVIAKRMRGTFNGIVLRRITSEIEFA